MVFANEVCSQVVHPSRMDFDTCALDTSLFPDPIDQNLTIPEVEAPLSFQDTEDWSFASDTSMPCYSHDVGPTPPYSFPFESQSSKIANTSAFGGQDGHRRSVSEPPDGFAMHNQHSLRRGLTAQTGANTPVVFHRNGHNLGTPTKLLNKGKGTPRNKRSRATPSPAPSRKRGKFSTMDQDIVRTSQAIQFAGRAPTSAPFVTLRPDYMQQSTASAPMHTSQPSNLTNDHFNSFLSLDPTLHAFQPHQQAAIFPASPSNNSNYMNRTDTGTLGFGEDRLRALVFDAVCKALQSEQFKVRVTDEAKLDIRHQNMADGHESDRSCTNWDTSGAEDADEHITSVEKLDNER